MHLQIFVGGNFILEALEGPIQNYESFKQFGISVRRNVLAVPFVQYIIIFFRILEKSCKKVPWVYYAKKGCKIKGTVYYIHIKLSDYIQKIGK